jgi:hypothetical protein
MHRERALTRWLAVVATLLAGSTDGCTDEPASKRSDPVDMGAAGSAAAPAATFTQIYAMMFPMATNARCDACHSMPANDIANGNLEMGKTQLSAYTALVGRSSTSSRCMAQPLVVPNHPEMSLLFQKLSPTPPCGSRMPLGGAAFNDAQMEMIRSWIAAGAAND